MPDDPEVQIEITGRKGESKASGAPWDRITFEAPAPWTEHEAYDPGTPAKDGAHSTYLLLARQTNVEAGTSFYVTAVRLETAVAVQHQSQWSLNFDPRFQRVSLHWLRVVRDGTRIDHRERDRMRLLQRETKLEHHVINGSWTLLAVLDDIRTGDIIEAGYTIENRHPISAGWCDFIFTVPAYFVVGKFRAAVLFEPNRPAMASRTSQDAPSRTEKCENGQTRWIWEGCQLVAREPETNVPSSQLDYIWIQVSDLPNWNSLAKRTAEHWQASGDGASLAEISGFSRPAQVDEKEVTRLIRLIQDDFRYLSIDLETGGWIPANPVAVVRQRFGDCKDLAWLATCVLRLWGVSARPILVGSGFRKSVAAFLPTTLLFNHAILEVEIGGWARWFDLTGRNQGGDFKSQSVSIFGCGLPVDPSADSLREQPNPSMPHQYALRENILVDTVKGESSALERRLWVSGYHADNLRRLRLTRGADTFADDRLKLVEKRFGKVSRLGPLEWRDDRDNNVCELVEAFSVSNFLTNEGGKRVTFDLAANLPAEFLPLPPDKARRNPWHMPYPFEGRHLITIRASSLGNLGSRRRKWSYAEFTGSLSEPRPRGEWSKSARIIVNVPEVAPTAVAEYRKHLVDFYKSLSWRIILPGNRLKPLTGSAFGKLPEAGCGIDAYVPMQDPAVFPEAVIGQSPKKHWREIVPAFSRIRWYIWLAWLLIMITTCLFQCSGVDMR